MAENPGETGNEKTNSQVEFITVDESWKDLRGYNPTSRKHSSSSFQNSYFGSANLIGMELEGCDFAHACLDGADLNGLVARNCNFDWASFRNSNLKDASFTECTFFGAIMTGSHMEKAGLYRCDCSDTLFLDCSLNEANLTGSTCSRARFNGSIFTGAIVDEVNFINAILSLDQFEEAASKRDVILSEPPDFRDDIVIVEVVRMPIQLSLSSMRALEKIVTRTGLSIDDLVVCSVLNYILQWKSQPVVK